MSREVRRRVYWLDYNGEKPLHLALPVPGTKCLILDLLRTIPEPFALAGPLAANCYLRSRVLLDIDVVLLPGYHFDENTGKFHVRTVTIPPQLATDAVKYAEIHHLSRRKVRVLSLHHLTATMLYAPKDSLEHVLVADIIREYGPPRVQDLVGAREWQIFKSLVKFAAPAK